MPETIAIANTALCLWIPKRTWSGRLLPWHPGSAHPDVSSQNVSWSQSSGEVLAVLSQQCSPCNWVTAAKTAQVDTLSPACLLSCFSLLSSEVHAERTGSRRTWYWLPRSALPGSKLSPGQGSYFLYAWSKASCVLFRGDDFTPKQTH